MKPLHRPAGLAAALVLVLTACSAATGGPGAGNRTDLDFVGYATGLIRFDQEEGALAATEARSPPVRDFARTLSERAGGFAAQFQAAEAASGIHPPSDLPYDLRVRLGHMNLQHGLDFDRTYVDDQIASHQNAVDAAQTEIRLGQSPELREIARRALPVVTDDLAQLRTLQLQAAP